jgi:hypothetical protein
MSQTPTRPRPAFKSLTMADAPFATAGVNEDPVGAQFQRNLADVTSFLSKVATGLANLLSALFSNARSTFMGLQVITTIGVFVINVILIATQTSGKTVPIVSFNVFFALFCLASWCVIVFAKPLGTMNDWDMGVTNFFTVLIALLSGIFNFTAALGTTLRISPAQSCTNGTYLSDNYLMQGSEERCHLIYTDIGFMWVGTIISRSF